MSPSNYLGSDAEVLEESLVRGPELPPHGFARLLIEFQQFGGFLKAVPGGDPEFYALIVDFGFVHVIHGHFTDAKGHARKGKLTGDVSTSHLHIHRHQFHRADAATLDRLGSKKAQVQVAERRIFSRATYPHRHISIGNFWKEKCFDDRDCRQIAIKGNSSAEYN